MSSFTGLSAILTVSLIALISVQMLKDKFDVIENFKSVDNNGMPFTIRDTSTAQNVSEEVQNLPIHENLNKLPEHGKTPFIAGDFFSPVYVSPNANANGYNGFSEAYSMYVASVNAATPTDNMLNAAGSSTTSLPGPNLWTQDSFANANVNTGRAANLSLCSQNMNTFGVGNGGVASSLLPMPNQQNELEGFNDCNVTNVLANQVFLTPSGVMGTNTVAGSLRNGNQDLRSEPPNPVLAVGPWMNSTIYPDLLRRPLEGCGPSFGLYGNGPYGGQTPTAIAP
jgi:hypothetical protein